MTIQIFEKKEKIFHAFKIINNRLLLLRFVIAQTIQSDFGHPKRPHERPMVFQGGSNTYKGHWNTEPTGPRTFLLYLSAFNMYRLNINSHTTLTLDCGIGSRDFKNHIRIGSRYIKNHNPDPDQHLKKSQSGSGTLSNIRIHNPDKKNRVMSTKQKQTTYKKGNL